MVLQLVQLVGAILVLAAFTLAQFRVLDPQSIPYLVLNVVGAAILAALALEEQQWGFLLLEGVWTLVSLGGLIGRLRPA
jgi:Na+/H+ antiporter NhaD/arsenite permease-like protein